MWVFNKLLKNNKDLKLEDNLKTILKTMAILDIIMVPENKKYLRLINFFKENNMEKYIINNGKGDSVSIYFLESDILIKGFDHENELNQFAAEDWNSEFFKHIYSVIPESLQNLLNEDDLDETTFVTCYLKNENTWKENKWKDNDGGKKYLLSYIKKNAEEWYDWAKDYYQKELILDLIEKFYSNINNINSEDIKLLNPSCNIEETIQLIKKVKL